MIQFRIEGRIAVEHFEELMHKLTLESKVKDSPQILQRRLKCLTLRKGRRLAKGPPSGVVLLHDFADPPRAHVQAASEIKSNEVVELPAIEYMTADERFSGARSELPKTVGMKRRALGRLVLAKIARRNGAAKVSGCQARKGDQLHPFGIGTISDEVSDALCERVGLSGSRTSQETGRVRSVVIDNRLLLGAGWHVLTLSCSSGKSK
jgi:hypothetical protein